METIGKRISYFLEKENISVSEFSEKTGLSSNMIYRLRSEERGLSSTSLAQIVEAYPMINVKWLITGIGNHVEVSTSQKNDFTTQQNALEEESSIYEGKNLKEKVKMILENEIVLDAFIEILKKHEAKGNINNK